ncbi:MAG: Do family serine endopeptidase [Pseudomonadota bacterium]
MKLNDKKGLMKAFAAGTLAGLVIIVISRWGGDLQKPIVEFKESTQTLDRESAGRVSYAQAVETAAPAVVNIYTTKNIPQRQGQQGQGPMFDDPLFRRFFGDELDSIPDRKLESLGSGVIISEQGFIITNNHVIEGADEVQVALRDGRTAEAKIVGTDPESDIGVLRIELKNLPAITLSKSDDLKVGDVVLAIGNPFGVGQTVTMGIVSATGRDRLGISTFENYIQTDAAINPGNSGGALVNTDGLLIGINTAIFSRTGGYEGIGFAIPVSIAKEVMQQIIEHGHAIRGWLGIEIQDITPALAESFNLKEVKGVIIAGVLRDGPAHKAGLKPGDVLVQINEKDVQDGRNAMNTIAKAAPGTAITLNIVRNGAKMSLKANTDQRPVPEDQ